MKKKPGTESNDYTLGLNHHKHTYIRRSESVGECMCVRESEGKERARESDCVYECVNVFECACVCIRMLELARITFDPIFFQS